MNHLDSGAAHLPETWWDSDEPAYFATSEASAWETDFATDEASEYLRYANIIQQLEDFAAAYAARLNRLGRG